MTARKLKAIYPGLWHEIESSIMDDLKFMQSKTITKRQMKVIAHNAAFTSCYVFWKVANILQGDLK